MYLKILSALTATFLTVLFLIMVQTVPSATTIEVADYTFLIFKVNCLDGEHFLTGTDLKKI